MTYITVKEASDKWGISTRRVCVLCSQGKIPGAVKMSQVWMIPMNASKPEDGRKVNVKRELNPMILLFNPLYFEFNIFDIPTKDEEALCEIQKTFLKGNIEKAYSDICNLLPRIDSRYSYMATILKVLLAADFGDKEAFILGMQALEKPVNNEEMYILERKIHAFYTKKGMYMPAYSSENESMYMEMMPLISLICAKKNINYALESAIFFEASSMEIICKELEYKNNPLILAYYHIFMAVYYNVTGNRELLNIHIRNAAQILLPRGWYTPLAEYSSTLDLKFVEEIDPQAYKIIMSLSQKIIGNYVKVGILMDFLNPKLDKSTNIQVGYKLVQGKSNEEIALELGISQYKVRKHIDDLLSVTGAENKKELKRIIIASIFV